MWAGLYGESGVNTTYNKAYTASCLGCLHTSMAGEVDRMQRREHRVAHAI